MESLDTKNDIAFIDSHCHLQDYANEDLNDILNSCSNINLKIFYSNSTSEADFQKNLDISQNQEILKKNNISKIIYGIGYHPWSLNYPLNNKEKWFDELVEFINENLIKKKIKYFIGEIGIDGGKIKKTFSLNDQIEIFKKQLIYANDNNLLVHIHCVYEWDKLYKIMSNINLDNLIKNKKILLHSFQGKVKHINKFNNLNVYYSISSGCYTSGNYEMLKNLPLDKILFESDSPSMFNKAVYNDAKEYENFYSENKKNNSPESIKYLCIKLAELKNMKYEDLAKIVYKNSLEVLNEFN
jgi:TatD DNase family protein